jgi:hypothetical protein
MHMHEYIPIKSGSIWIFLAASHSSAKSGIANNCCRPTSNIDFTHSYTPLPLMDILTISIDGPSSIERIKPIFGFYLIS